MPASVQDASVRRDLQDVAQPEATDPRTQVGVRAVDLVPGCPAGANLRQTIVVTTSFPMSSWLMLVQTPRPLRAIMPRTSNTHGGFLR